MKDGWPVPAMFKAQKHAMRQQAKKEINDILEEEYKWQNYLYSFLFTKSYDFDWSDEIDDNCYCETCLTYGYHN